MLLVPYKYKKGQNFQFNNCDKRDLTIQFEYVKQNIKALSFHKKAQTTILLIRFTIQCKPKTTILKNSYRLCLWLNLDKFP